MFNPKISLVLACLTSAFMSFPSVAQDNREKTPNHLEETEEITIIEVPSETAPLKILPIIPEPSENCSSYTEKSYRLHLEILKLLPDDQKDRYLKNQPIDCIARYNYRQQILNLLQT